MKIVKIVLIALVAFAFSPSESQAQARLQTQLMTGSTDTVTDTEVDSLTYTVLTNNLSKVGVQYTATKISGTVAGTAILYGSLDGINFNVLELDTFTNANVTTNTHIWVVTNPIYKRYKVVVTGSGTMAARIYGYLTGIVKE